MSEKLIPVVSIVGPTASGKTELAVDLALKFNGEIVSSDSMQIYKEFEISTAKPSLNQLSAIEHHLVNFLSVSEEFSVAKFAQVAHECIKNIHLRGKLPFLVGGTGLYIDAVLKNIDFDDTPHFLESVNTNFCGLNNVELMNKLEKIDVISARKIHVNDRKRLLRAIEFFYSTGYPISEQVEKSKKARSFYKTCRIGLGFKDRDVLYKRINDRVDKMFKSGLIQEVTRISKFKVSKTAASAIGYKEILDCLDNKCSPEEAAKNLKQATRRYAKRQLTWFRRDKDINWIYADEFEKFCDITQAAANILKNFIGDSRNKL